MSKVEINRVYGSPPPPSLLADLTSANEIPDRVFEKALTFAEELIVKERVAPTGSVEAAARGLGVSESSLLALVRMYSNMRHPFLGESSKDSFVSELASLGLEQKKAEAVWGSLSEHREEIGLQLRPALRMQFGPVISDINWRVDKVIKSSEPFPSEAVGVVSLTFETSSETFDERFETDIRGLDRIIAELSKLRKELSRDPELEESKRRSGRKQN